MKILVINGPNLNMLGRRDPAIYGSCTLSDIEAMVAAEVEGVDTEWFASNYEGAIIERLHAVVLNGDVDGVVINAGAYSHYSIAIRDALDMVSVPKVEVHLSNIYEREEFRRTSVLSAVCDECIVGLGAIGYVEAVRRCAERVK